MRIFEIEICVEIWAREDGEEKKTATILSYAQWWSTM